MSESKIKRNDRKSTEFVDLKLHYLKKKRDTIFLVFGIKQEKKGETWKIHKGICMMSRLKALTTCYVFLKLFQVI